MGTVSEISFGEPERRGSTAPVDAWVVLGDSSLLLLSLVAAASFLLLSGAATQLDWFTGILGLAFALQAAIDLIEQTHLAIELDRSSTPPAGAPEASAAGDADPLSPGVATPSSVGSRVFEATLLLAFGAAAVALAAQGQVTATIGAGSALGLGALAKALPSVLNATKGTNEAAL